MYSKWEELGGRDSALHEDEVRLLRLDVDLHRVDFENV
jgi:hypothetical protein